jgi:hypothetical protein
MVKNMGKQDRTIRITIALVVGVLIITGQLVGTVAIILGILSVVLLATGALGTCPLYMVCKCSTLKKPEEKPEEKPKA